MLSLTIFLLFALLLQAFVESPKFLGIPLGGFHIELQYITNEELERRRWTITTTEMENGFFKARCPAYDTCKSWKPYKLVDRDGNEELDDNGNVKYPGHFICAEKLEDKSPDTGVGPFNRQLLARVPSDSKERDEKNPQPTEWHVQDFFQGYDMFIMNFGLEGLGFGIFRLNRLSFTLILFGDIQPAINPDEEFPDEESRIFACEQEAANDGLFVYMEIEASVTVLFIVSFDGRLTLGNVPVTPGSGVALPDSNEDANKWFLDARAEVFIIGMTAVVTARGEWFYVGDNRRRLQEEVGPCAETRRRKLQSENFQRALDESVGLDDVPFEYNIEMSCDSFLDCLEDIGTFVLEKLTETFNAIVLGIEKLVDFAGEVFGELASIIGEGLDWLGLDFVADAFEDLWADIGETFDKAISRIEDAAADGFQFR